MKTSAAARRYARALFSLARETNTLTDVRSELADVAELFAGDRALHRRGNRFRGERNGGPGRPQ